MLLNDYMFPTLLIAFDSVPMDIKEIAESVKYDLIADSYMGKSDIEAANRAKLALDASDLTSKLLRFPIVFSDAILPAHVVGVTSASNKKVDYMGNKPIVYDGGNVITVQITMKSSISDVGNAATLLYALSDKLYEMKTNSEFSELTNVKISPRVSFFSPTFTIMDGYLLGVNRATVKGSDTEILELRIEKTVPPREDKTNEVKKVTDTASSTPAINHEVEISKIAGA